MAAVNSPSLGTAALFHPHCGDDVEWPRFVGGRAPFAGDRMQSDRFGRLGRLAALGLALLGTVLPAQAQQVDCGRLQQLIAQRGSRGGGAVLRRQSAEIARTQAMMRQYGCDGSLNFFGGGNPNCTGLTQRLQGLQAGMAQLQAGEGGSRGELVARYDAYCRGGQPAQPAQPRGFFESLFGGGEQRREPVPQLPPQAPQGPREADADEGDYAHGGSQAVCVRTCDGGFFPLGISARHGKESLVEMCQALCPGTETEVFTRNPDADIKTAASLEGKPYTELPNALKFEKNFSASCTCRQAGKSWAETLANAEEVLGATRKGDIVVTKEKSDELSRPRFDAKATAALLAKGQAVAGAPAKASPADASKLAGATADNDAGAAQAGETGLRGVRRVGPQN